MAKNGKSSKDGHPSTKRPDAHDDAGGASKHFDWFAALKKTKCWLQVHEGLSVILNIFLITAVVLLGIPLLSKVFEWFEFPSSKTITLFLLLVLIVIMVSCIAVFTKPLPAMDNEKGASAADSEGCLDDYSMYFRLKRQWMILAYSFMVFSLVAAVMPFTLDFLPDPDNGLDYRTHRDKTLDRPIAVVPGCVLGNGDAPNALACYPDGKDKPPALSWVLHIGGNLTAHTPPDKYKARNLSEIEATIAELEKKLQVAREGEARAGQAYEAVENEYKQLNTGAVSDEVLSAAEAKRENAGSAWKKAEVEVQRWEHEIVYLKTFLQGNAGFGIRGGLVVPIYLIILSMIGAAISLTRRIPEYQKQATPGYVGTVEAPFLPPSKLREYLVFQIVQFVSAPFLATVAYFVIEPDTTTAAVALAFAAGFSSETVLLWIRGVVDKIKPQNAPEVKTGAVVGSVPELQGKTSAEIEKLLSISVVGRHDLQVAFADGGQFVIESVPGGEWALEIIKQDPGNSTKQILFRKIKVLADKAAPVLIDFAAP